MPYNRRTMLVVESMHVAFDETNQNISHLKVFGCKCFILKNGKDNFDKFTEKLMKISSLAIHCMVMPYNRRTMLVVASIHIAFDETNQNMQESPKTSVDDEVPTGQKVNSELQNKSDKVTQL